MMPDLTGKVAVITGGSSGIGQAAAKEFVSLGAKVVISGRDEKLLEQAAGELGSDVLAISADVTQLGDLSRLFERAENALGKVDILGSGPTQNAILRDGYKDTQVLSLW